MAQKIFMDYAKELMDFFEENGMELDPRPKIVFDNSGHGRFDPFVPTGHYDYSDDEITLYTSERQCKDILRTLAHELVHVNQFRSDPEGYKSFDKGGNLVDNPVLRKFESEAYEKGNLLFREWTEANS